MSYLSPKQTIKLLNKLGPVYHAYYGIYPNKNSNKVEYIIKTLDSDTIKIIKKAIKHNDIVMNTETDEILKDVSHIDIYEDTYEYMIFYDYDTLIAESKLYIPYKTVIIRNEDCQIKDLDHWYNKRSTKLRNVGYLRPYMLPYLNTMHYLVVNKPFLDIIISSELKKNPLSISDILFATRGLMIDETRTIDQGYKILSEDLDTLIVEPNIDNWSD